MNDLDRRVVLEVSRALKTSRGITPLRRHRALLNRETWENVILYGLTLANVGIYLHLAEILLGK